MELGMVGLGRMGANMAERLVHGGHRVHGYDPGEGARSSAQAKGIVTADALAALVSALPSPRVVWLMVPAGKIVDDTLAQLLPLLQAGDIVIDGGNSYYKDSQRRAALHASGIAFVDCGTSGGVWGLQEGYSLMVGGDEAAVTTLHPVLATLAPAADKGWGRVGPSGAGHFTKMVHNGIEYGMMQAYAEGFALMQHKSDFALDLHQSRRSGAMAAWCVRGCWISPPMRWRTIRPWPVSHRSWPIRAKGAGRWPRRSTRSVGADHHLVADGAAALARQGFVHRQAAGRNA